MYSEPEYPDYLAPSDAEDPEEDLEEDHTNYPADGGNGNNEPSDDDDGDDDTNDKDEEPFEDEDDDEEEEKHLALAELFCKYPIMEPCTSCWGYRSI
ncbi:hypothetical protein Tco_0396596 [Tanacetum coccineum]